MTRCTINGSGDLTVMTRPVAFPPDAKDLAAARPPHLYTVERNRLPSVRKPAVPYAKVFPVGGEETCEGRDIKQR